MDEPKHHFYEFGHYRIDMGDGLLLYNGEVVALPPKTFELLVVLAESGGRVIPKDELMSRVWPDSFVEEANLSHHVFILRKALGEDKNGAKFIETIPRRGYRFVAPITELIDARNDLVVAEHTRSYVVIEEDEKPDTAEALRADDDLSEKALTTGQPQKRWTRFKRYAVVWISCVVVIGLGMVLYFWMTTNRKPEGTGLAVKSIAVLPLKALGDNPGDSEYLADGISETLITRLTRMPNLRVIPWVTAERYKESNKSLPTVADEMNVDALIIGSLRRVDDRIAVTVSLIDGQSGLQYWADEFEEPIVDIFTVQRKIALGAARELKGKLSSQQEQTLSHSASRSAEAYEYYLRGNAAYRQGRTGSKELNQLAFDLFEKALKIDPNLAEAYAGIGRVEYRRSQMGWSEIKMANAEASFQQALVLNPTLAEAHIGLISVSFSDGKCEDGLKYAQKAASLGLEDADMLSVRARAYFFAGIWDKAVLTYRRAIELDPANETNSMIIPAYLFTGDYHKAISAGEMFLRRFRDLPRVHYYTALAHHCLGDFERAKMHYEQAIKLAPQDTTPYNTFGYLLKQNGQPSEARRIWIQGLGILKRMVNESPQNLGLHGKLAEFYGQLGNRDALLEEERWILREEPDNGHSLGSLADAFARLGETERAIEHYRRALQVGFLTFSPRALLKVDGTEKLEQSPAYHEFINELTQITDRLREQY